MSYLIVLSCLTFNVPTCLLQHPTTFYVTNSNSNVLLKSCIYLATNLFNKLNHEDDIFLTNLPVIFETLINSHL